MCAKCIYCGDEATTRDHIPPQSFFPKPAPSNLVTVPACFKCNNTFSGDEEYLRTILVSAKAEEGKLGLADKLWNQKVEKSLLRNPRLFVEISKEIGRAHV